VGAARRHDQRRELSQSTRSTAIGPVATADDVREALRFARGNRLKVIAAAAQHGRHASSGTRRAGHDRFQQMSLDAGRKCSRSERRALARDQSYCIRNNAVKAMHRPTSSPSVESITVTPHGMDHHAARGRDRAPMRVMAADGSINRPADREPRAFNLVVAGTSVGVILTRTSTSPTNAIYRLDRRTLGKPSFQRVRARHREGQPLRVDVRHLSTSPASFLDE